jgi:hypothetical protein
MLSNEQLLKVGLTMQNLKFVTHRGGCHCRQVQFEIDAPAVITVQDCNCSVCAMSGFLHLIVPKSQFRLLRGHEFISEYTFNTGVAKHRFCKICGVKSFYIPRSNPDGVDVNARCLLPGSITKMHIEAFDGQNWERHASSLTHLSKS